MTSKAFEFVSKLSDDGRDMPQELKHFCHILAMEMRGIKFVPRNSRTMWAYRDGDLVTMGYVGYGDFRNTAKEEVKSYIVYSHTITNDKYSDYSEQYRMKMTTNVTVAVRNAKKYLRKWTPMALNQAFRSVLINGVRTIQHQVSREFGNVSHQLFGGNHSYGRSGSPALINELRLLLDSGHKFFDTTVADKLREYFELEAAANKAGLNKAAFVCVTEHLGNQRIDVMPLDERAEPDESDPPKVYSDETLPEDIAGKLAVLSMCKSEDFIEEVGVKVQDGAYYVAW